MSETNLELGPSAVSQLPTEKISVSAEAANVGVQANARDKTDALETAPVSVLICTRNRLEDLLHALPGVLAQDYSNYEVVLIDQSTDDEVERQVRLQFGADPRLRYIRTATVGLSIARNLALHEARHEICAFTDDDCDVPPQWVANTARLYRTHPETQIAFSPVHIPASLSKVPNILFPCLYFSDDRLLRNREIFGMGANMSMRKSAWERIGPFDTLLGAGGLLPGAEEHDWLYRAHRLHMQIRLDPNNAIDHHAFRTIEEWIKMHAVYSVGDAAFAMKHLRCGDLHGAVMLLRTLSHYSGRILMRTIRHQGAEAQSEYLRGYWGGIWKSRRYSVDRHTLLYRQSPPSA